MKVIKAGEFQAKCLKLMDKIARTGETIVVAKNGTLVARLVPVKRQPKTLYGALKGAVIIKDDIIAPIDVRWDARQWHR